MFPSNSHIHSLVASYVNSIIKLVLIAPSENTLYREISSGYVVSETSEKQYTSFFLPKYTIERGPIKRDNW